MSKTPNPRLFEQGAKQLGFQQIKGSLNILKPMRVALIPY